MNSQPLFEKYLFCISKSSFSEVMRSLPFCGSVAVNRPVTSVFSGAGPYVRVVIAGFPALMNSGGFACGSATADVGWRHPRRVDIESLLGIASASKVKG
jgi:hypothetical protein